MEDKKEEDFLSRFVYKLLVFSEILSVSNFWGLINLSSEVKAKLV